MVNAAPPAELLYHLMSVPVADRLATVGLLPEQNVCGLLAKGAAGVSLTVTVAALGRLAVQPAAFFIYKV